MTLHNGALLTVIEACEYLRITRATLYRWAGQGRLRLIKIGERSTRVPLQDLRSLIAGDESAEKRGWAALSVAAFAGDWDNDQDAVYDNWRQIYGVREG